MMYASTMKPRDTKNLIKVHILRDRIAANIRRAQENKGMTGRQVADAVGATPMQYSKWRVGETPPGLGYMIKLADALTNGSVAYFYTEHDGEAPA